MTSSRAAPGALLGLLAAVLLGTLAFLYSRTEALDFRRDAEMLSLLRELNDLDARWDADASRFSVALTPGPALPDRGPMLARILRELERASGRPEVEAALPAIKEGMAGKSAAWESLRRRHAKSLETVRFAVQPEATGTAHAVLAEEPLVGDRPFLFLNADNLYPVDVLRSLVALEGPGLPAFERARLVQESGFPEARVAQFAVLRVDPQGWLSGILEKPDAGDLEAAGPRALISMNVWRFDARIFDACRDVPRSTRGEHELPEAVGLAVACDVRFRVLPAHGAVLDLSRRADISRVSARLGEREAHL